MSPIPQPSNIMPGRFINMVNNERGVCSHHLMVTDKEQALFLRAAAAAAALWHAVGVDELHGEDGVERDGDEVHHTFWGDDEGEGGLCWVVWPAPYHTPTLITLGVK